MDKHRILEEIKRLASARDGKPPLLAEFERETGIRKKDWKLFWVRWDEALAEAGFYRANSNDYVQVILTCVAACADFENGANQDLRFFRELNSALKPQSGERRHGNRNFLVSPFQQSIINFFNSVDAGEYGKLSATGSPRIQWKTTSPLQNIGKQFDILIVKPQSRKSVAIEIKGRDFPGIAPAMMEIGLAIKFGEYLVRLFNGKSERFPITSQDTLFVVLLADSGGRDEPLFRGMKALLGDPANVSFHAIFPEHLRLSDPQYTHRKFTGFFTEVFEFLK